MRGVTGAAGASAARAASAGAIQRTGAVPRGRDVPRARGEGGPGFGHVRDRRRAQGLHVAAAAQQRPGQDRRMHSTRTRMHSDIHSQTCIH